MDISGLQIVCCNTDDLRRQLQFAVQSMRIENGWLASYDHVGFTNAIDPQANFVAIVDGAIVSAISACNYGDEFCFMGGFVTAKAFRGQGIGKKLFEECLKHAENRLIGLYSLESMVEWYKRYGFEQMSATVGSVIRLSDPRKWVARKGNDSLQIVAVADVNFDDLCRFDRKYFPADRKEFLKKWLTHPHVACSCVCLKDGKISGYGMIRKCVGDTMGKMGPVFADGADVAETLIVTLLSSVPEGIQRLQGKRLAANAQAGVLAEKLGFKDVQLGGAIMFRNGRPDFAVSGVYWCSSGEYG